MGNTLNNVGVGGDDWIELTAVSGVTEGDAFEISNVSRPYKEAHHCYFAVAASKPAADSVDSKILTTMDNKSGHTYAIPAGDAKVYAKACTPAGATINIKV